MSSAKRRTPVTSRARNSVPPPARARADSPGTVLITGGTGFLGAHLVRQLAAAGEATVRVLARGAPDWLVDTGAEPVMGSITDRDVVERAVEGVSEIYHLAGIVSRAGHQVREMYEVQIEGTRILCEAARRSGVRTVVVASTSGTVAVSRDSGQVMSEDDTPALELILKWPYYASKLYQERTALEHFDGEGRRLVIVNPSLLLGPGDDRLTSTRVVLDFLQRKIPVAPPGGLNFVDARDVALACRAAMRHGRHGARYLLGAANWTFRELFERLERLTKTRAPRMTLPSALSGTGVRLLREMRKRWSGAPEIEPMELEMASHFWYFDSSRARRELGFAPRDPYDTLSDTVAYVRERFLDGAKDAGDGWTIETVADERSQT
ncbi:MAG TPA: NAD-dependent epimerase/dehydratase family protein [Gemmatimonadaceae bacterium]|nr:NAD-dependent epimerase/dehydratase family protein [Gemmatimonadaceae bacterium]